MFLIGRDNLGMFSLLFVGNNDLSKCFYKMLLLLKFVKYMVIIRFGVILIFVSFF